MSTDHQRYSIDNQSAAIREYARLRGIEVVRTYEDAGRSGLTFDGRQSLQRLLADVLGGAVDFQTILVYDVSRWGRFQDADEAAHYEYLCRRAGVGVEYCAEQFANDGGPFATVVKSIKRAMAGEYSRELSVKVFRSGARLAGLGQRQGGRPPYGMRRATRDEAGRIGSTLGRHERKSLETDHIVLVPGPRKEIRVVRKIFALYVANGLSRLQIAQWLNQREVPAPSARLWGHKSINRILENEAYIGRYVWNRRSCKLKTKVAKNDSDVWIRADGAFEPIVSQEMFEKARAIAKRHYGRLTDDELIDCLRQLFERHGYLSKKLLLQQRNFPCTSTYALRFGSLYTAFARAGYVPTGHVHWTERRRRSIGAYDRIIGELVAGIERVDGRADRGPATDLLIVNGELSISVCIVRPRPVTIGGALEWRLLRTRDREADLTLVVRMPMKGDAPMDYYLLPKHEIPEPKPRFTLHNGFPIDSYRSDTLEPIYSIAARSTVEKAP
jgi:DNA invertase Pin-like site-specific DNA recombinase